jgi:hypothetical protein
MSEVERYCGCCNETKPISEFGDSPQGHCGDCQQILDQWLREHPEHLREQNQPKRGMAYNSWSNMKSRCDNPKATGYHLWGGRGITVCERWRDFDNFLADMGPRPIGHSLDRINPDGNYEPDNCRWATARQQGANQRPQQRRAPIVARREP